MREKKIDCVVGNGIGERERGEKEGKRERETEGMKERGRERSREALCTHTSIVKTPCAFLTTPVTISHWINGIKLLFH